MDIFASEGSGFHLFNKDSVSLSSDDVDIEEEDEDETAVETEETTVDDGEKVAVLG